MAETEEQLIGQGKLPIMREALPPLEPYDLRHTFCTDLERAGVPINVASQLMGHADIKITASIYTHTDDAVFAEAGEKLSRLTDIVTDIVDMPESPYLGTKTGKSKKRKTGT